MGGENRIFRDHEKVFWSFFWLCLAACGTLVPRSGIEPGPLAVKVQSLNHWTAGEFPREGLLTMCFLYPVFRACLSRLGLL